MANLYAEYLPNIKTLAVTTVLQTPRDGTTALWLSNDRKKVILEHADETHRITLPAKVTGQGTQHLQLPNTGELQCVNRISAAPIFDDGEPPALWSASSLNAGTNLHCERCDALLSSNKISVWKDLPSEAWAEMMDLWHCHKPEEPKHTDDDAPAKKGYAAGNKLVAQAGVGLVDVMSFLLSDDDCTVEFRSSENGDNVHEVNCITCDTALGHRDPQTEGVRLQKPYLALSQGGSRTTRSYDPAHWFSCYLNQAIETQGVRKFVFSTLPYEIWVFSTNLAYASLEYPEPKQAMKVLFRTRQGDQDVETLRAANLLIETLTLSPMLEKLLYQVLQRENSKLPDSLKNFVGWEVAVLPVLYKADVKALESATYPWL
ncbi:hypothetical protein D6C91_02939 [Aureobasidium pullulans]|uniref:Ubiquitin-conjugating enzyme E2C-binding protein n=1 Tax=Aureobasidium pullulans TaxID=5580 RepID=A0A4S9TLV2_AURPU|nr:hypothetical protein D6C91_02939 [Aureobasidium pullulans]